MKEEISDCMREWLVAPRLKWSETFFYPLKWHPPPFFSWKTTKRWPFFCRSYTSRFLFPLNFRVFARSSFSIIQVRLHDLGIISAAFLFVLPCTRFCSIILFGLRSHGCTGYLSFEYCTSLAAPVTFPATITGFMSLKLYQSGPPLYRTRSP